MTEQSKQPQRDRNFSGAPGKRVQTHPFAQLDWSAAHTADIQVRYSDADAMGHINNAVYVTYLETARVSLMREMGADITDIQTVVARIELDYVAEIRQGVPVQVQTLTERLGNSSFTLAVRILGGGKPCAYARTVLVNLGEDGKPAPLGGTGREMLARLQVSVPAQASAPAKAKAEAGA